jgi:hypothetical protein
VAPARHRRGLSEGGVEEMKRIHISDRDFMGRIDIASWIHHQRVRGSEWRGVWLVEPRGRVERSCPNLHPKE